jgi:DUF4097 and DUF4098 domain-containing protein YvlB
LLLSFLASTQLSAKVEDTVEESFSTKGPGLLTLQLQSSSVDIDTYNGSDVSIAVTRTMKHGDKKDFENELEKLDLRFEQSGNDIRCILEYKQNKRGWSLFSGRKPRLNFKTVVRIPKEFDVDANTSGGSIDIKNLIGDASLHTSGGGIEMDNVEGAVTARTSGGGIRAKDCKGNVEMRTSGGSIKADNIAGTLYGKTSGGHITVQDVNGNTEVSTSGGSINLGTVAGNLQASTSGGSIYASLAGQPTEDCLLKTSGGSIHIAVDPKANIQIDAATSGGSVTTKLSLASLESKRSSIKGQLNAGGPTLKTRTSGGSIHINSI